MSENANGTDNTPETDSTNSAPESQAMKSLPDWAKKELADARKEAGDYRVKAREAMATAKAEAEKAVQDQLKQLGDTKTELSDKLSVAELELAKIKVALSAEIPGESVLEFAGLLQGSTKDELEAHAKTVKKLVNLTGNAYDRSQGAGGEGPKDTQDVFRGFVLDQIDKTRNRQ